MFDYWTNRLLRWWLRRKVRYLQRLRATYEFDYAEVCRLGRPAAYWEGAADGIDAALKLLELADLGKDQSHEPSPQPEHPTGDGHDERGRAARTEAADEGHQRDPQR